MPGSNPASTATYKVVGESRDLTAASGDVSYTGYGFKPKLLILFAAGVNSDYGCWGMADETLVEEVVFTSSLAGFSYQNSKIILFQTGAGADQSAILKSMDSDGFTLTWTKNGYPSGTAYIKVTAIS